MARSPNQCVDGHFNLQIPCRWTWITTVTESVNNLHTLFYLSVYPVCLSIYLSTASCSTNFQGAKRVLKPSKSNNKWYNNDSFGNPGHTFEPTKRPGHQILSERLPQDSKGVPRETSRISRFEEKLQKADHRISIKKHRGTSDNKVATTPQIIDVSLEKECNPSNLHRPHKCKTKSPKVITNRTQIDPEL